MKGREHTVPVIVASSMGQRCEGRVSTVIVLKAMLCGLPVPKETLWARVSSAPPAKKIQSGKSGFELMAGHGMARYSGCCSRSRARPTSTFCRNTHALL